MTYETKKNAKNATFFYKERKRMQRTPRFFIKNAKERKERRGTMQQIYQVILNRKDKFQGLILKTNNKEQDVQYILKY